MVRVQPARRRCRQEGWELGASCYLPSFGSIGPHGCVPRGGGSRERIVTELGNERGGRASLKYLGSQTRRVGGGRLGADRHRALPGRGLSTAGSEGGSGCSPLVTCPGHGAPPHLTMLAPPGQDAIAPRCLSLWHRAPAGDGARTGTATAALLLGGRSWSCSCGCPGASPPSTPPATLTSSSAMMRSSSSSSLMAEAMMGGVDAGLTTSDTVRLSFTCGFWVSSSSDSAFCGGAGR